MAIKGIAVREWRLIGTISIYKGKVPLSICPLPTVIIKSYTNNIYNRLWRLKGLQLENVD